MEESSEVRITLRLSSALRDYLAASAERNSRSMNGEILARLEETVSQKFNRVDSENLRLGRRLESIERNLERLMGSVGAELARHNFVRSDPLRRSPETVMMEEGSAAYRANPDGPYENPYPSDHVKHRHFRNGFNNAANRHFSSDDELYARFPELDERELYTIDEALGAIDNDISEHGDKHRAGKALKYFRDGKVESALSQLRIRNSKFENRDAAILAIQKHLIEIYAANWGNPDTAGDEESP